MLVIKEKIESIDAATKATSPLGKQATFKLSIPLTLDPSNVVDLIGYQRVNISQGH